MHLAVLVLKLAKLLTARLLEQSWQYRSYADNTACISVGRGLGLEWGGAHNNVGGLIHWDLHGRTRFMTHSLFKNILLFQTNLLTRFRID